MHADQAEEKICLFVEQLTFDAIPERVIDSAKMLLLDLIGVMCLSHKAKTTETFIRAIQNMAGRNGEGTVVGSAFKLPFQYAAMLNGVLAHSSEYDDTNALGHSHPGAVIIPAVLSASQLRESVTGKEFLTAMVAGYEIMCRVGASLGATVHARGFHVTPICGIFGAVCAIAKLFHMDAVALHSALGLAGSFTSGSHQFTENGAWNKRLHPGLMAHHALLCVQFATEGILGAAMPLTGNRGFLKGYTDDPLPEKLDQDLGHFWYTDQTAIKPYPACRLIHGTIDIVSDFVKERDVPIDEIKQFEIEISPRAFFAAGERTERKLNPQNIIDAQFSVYYQVAAIFLNRIESTDVYRFVGDPRIPEITSKIHVKQNDSLGKLETHVYVLAGRKAYRLHTSCPKGEPQNPLSWDEAIRKYNQNSMRLGDERQQGLVNRIQDFDKQEQLVDFYKLLALEL